MKYIFENFDSVVEFVKTLEKRPVKDGWGTQTSKTASYSWTGTDSYEEASNLALFGDKKSAEKVQASLKKIKDAKTGFEERALTKIKRSVIGSRPCVPAAVMGHPCSMYRRQVTKVEKPVVSIYYSMSMNGGTDADVLINAGAKMAEAIQIIERSGVRVNLYVGNTSCTRSQATATFVRVKDSAKDFDLLRMAYPLINPSFFRRHWFRWVETKQELRLSEWRRGYGKPLDEIEERDMFKAIKDSRLKCDILLTTSNVLRMSEEDIANKVLGK